LHALNKLSELFQSPPRGNRHNLPEHPATDLCFSGVPAGASLGCWPDGGGGVKVANPIHFEETGESRDKRREERREKNRMGGRIRKSAEVWIKTSADLRR